MYIRDIVSVCEEKNGFYILWGILTSTYKVKVSTCIEGWVIKESGQTMTRCLYVVPGTLTLTSDLKLDLSVWLGLFV